MASTGFEQYYDKITEYCLKAYAEDNVDDVTALATGVMDIEGFPMHYPTHHYMVPAVLLSAARKKQGHSLDVIERDLAEALERALEVPGGACGYQGACGAAVGVGIFISILTDTAPTSAATWAIGNRATGTALINMAEYGGPRCCKRCSYIGLLTAVKQAAKELDLQLTASQPICHYYENNQAECLKERCPFYPKA